METMVHETSDKDAGPACDRSRTSRRVKAVWAGLVEGLGLEDPSAEVRLTTKRLWPSEAEQAGVKLGIP